MIAAVGALLVALVAGVAYAATVDCRASTPCLGTAGPDKLVGTPKRDEMSGLADADRLLGYRGADTIYGDNIASDPDSDGTSADGDDELFANNGEDVLYGFGGSDTLRGGGRIDFIVAEELSLNPGVDTVRGDGGRDQIFALDGYQDVIDCGDNEDTVFFDVGRDLVADNCEVRNPGGARAAAKSLPGGARGR